MTTSRIKRRLLITGIVVTLLGLWGSWHLLTVSSPSVIELPNLYINYGMVSVYLQPFMLVIVYSQLLPFRDLRVFVGVRRKTARVQCWLLLLATVYSLLFLLGLFIPYLFSGYPFFKNGSPVIGSLIILAHVVILLVFNWLLALSYRLPHPYLLILLVLLLEFVYHIYFEKNILIQYSPLYDPIYRAIHHIYGGY